MFNETENKIISDAVNAGVRTPEEVMAFLEGRIEFLSELGAQKTNRSKQAANVIFSNLYEAAHK